MRTRTALLVLITLTVVGCGGSEEEHVEAPPPHEVDTAVAATSTAAEASPEEPGDDELSFAPPFPKKENPFAPPKETEIFVEPEEPAEDLYALDADQLASLPPMRLLGFVDVNGKRAMLSYDGEIKLVAKGDRLKMLEVVEVDYPNLTLQHYDKSLAMNLFEQEWTHLPSAGNRRGVRALPPDEVEKMKLEAKTNKIPMPDLPSPGGRSPTTGLPEFPDFNTPEEEQVDADRSRLTIVSSG